MNLSDKQKKIIGELFFAFLATIIILGSFFGYWNSAPADQTCASCHEIVGSVHTFANSAHQELSCKECHGTALSNGLHSMKEKSMMVVNHFRGANTEDIRMNEYQVLEVMNNCKRCHGSEYAKWESGGHSATYERIFLDSVHNSKEQLNYDCLRCHGMFFEGTMEELVKPVSVNGPWKLTDKKRSEMHTIPCMACHMVHTDGYTTSELLAEDPYSDSARFFPPHSPGLSFYDRAEKANYPVELMSTIKLYGADTLLTVSSDGVTRNCVQCHSPNAWHEAGTSDDRIPRGVHKGLSCAACHEPHSNYERNSCATCHPAISNCNLDVTQMNTTYADKNSPNNIHFVSCTDCH